MPRGRSAHILRQSFPGVSCVIDPDGNPRYRFRKQSKGRRVDAYVHGEFASPEFYANYKALKESLSRPAVQNQTEIGSLAWLIELYFESQRYRDLSASRKSSIRRELDWLRAQAGKYRVADLKTRHVEALMMQKNGPSAANTVKKNLSMLFNFAIRYGYGDLTHNCAKYAERRKEKTGGYHTWTLSEITRFFAVHGSGTKERLAGLLILNTGAARQDVVRMGWQSVEAGRIKYSRGKTQIGGDYPILPMLQAELAKLPPSQELFIVHGKNKPYQPETFSNWFKDACVAAGLPHCSAHGLRKALATLIAEEGGSEFEVMSYLAHSTPKEGATYTRQASRSKLANSALARVLGDGLEKMLSNPLAQPDGAGL